MNTDDVTRSAFGISLDAALRDLARAAAAVEYLREKLAALPEPIEAVVPVAAARPLLDAITDVARPKGPAGGRPTVCPDCRKPMGSSAGMSAHRRSAHPDKVKGAASIAMHQEAEAERIREVAADIRAREPAVRAEVDAFAARREEAARARAAAAWARRHEDETAATA